MHLASLVVDRERIVVGCTACALLHDHASGRPNASPETDEVVWPRGQVLDKDDHSIVVERSAELKRECAWAALAAAAVPAAAS